MRGFFVVVVFNFSAFISVDSLKMANKVEFRYGVLGTAPKEIHFVQTLLQKELYGRVRTVCKQKPTGRAKFAVFHLLIGLGYESEHILVKTPAIFSLVRYIYTWIFENQVSKKINVNSFYYLAV